MRRAAVLVALLLAVAPLAAAVPGPTASGAASVNATQPPVVDPGRNTSEYLALPEGTVERERVGSVTLDVGGSLAADAARIHDAFNRSRLTAAYERAETTEARRAVLSEAADRTEAAIDDLAERERRARSRYVAGDLTTRAYLRELAIVSARAAVLRDVVDRLSELDAATAGDPLADDRLAEMAARVVGLHGPVRDLVRRAMSGSVDRVRVAVAAGSSGVVLAAIAPDEGTYVREAYVPAARAPSAPNRYDQPASEIIDRVEELYPWTVNNSGGVSVSGLLPSPKVYLVRLPYEHGLLQAYLDGGSDKVFYETQRKQLRSLPTRDPVAAESAGLALVVNRTQAAGPVQIRVVDSVTRDPVDAVVTVDGTTVGRTGPDGTIWTVTPASRFTVTAADGDANVSTTVSPAP